MDQAVNDEPLNKTSLMIVDGAPGGQSAEKWIDTPDPEPQTPDPRP
jgi:hypothetical protein